MEQQGLQVLNDEGRSPSLTMLEITSHLRKLNYPEKALQNYLHCGEMTSMFLIGSCACSTYPLRITRNCNKRFCERCGEKRKKRLARKLRQYLFYFSPTRLYSYKFLTISPQNYDNLEEGLKYIKKSFSKFIRRKYIKERVQGGFSVIEVTNNGNGWHIHLHVILYSRKLDNVYRGKCKHCSQTYLKYDRNSEKFYCANRKCGHIFEGVFEDSKLKREFSASSGRDCRTHISQVSSRKKVVNYCLKYVTTQKDSFQNDFQFAQFIKATYNERLVSPFGVFSGNKKNSQYRSFSEFLKTYKNPCYCPLCNTRIKFQYDSEISDLLYASSNPPPKEGLLEYF